MQLALSIEEVRAYTGIGKTRLYEALNRGQLKAKKFGRKTIILKDDLDDFLESLDSYLPENED